MKKINQFKKILSVILCIGILMSCFVVVGATGTEDVTTEADYLPTNPVAMQSSSNASHIGVRLSWVNPVADTLTKVTAYNVASGTDTKLTEWTSPVAGGIVDYADETSGMAKGSFYDYKIVFEFSNHENMELLLSGKAGGAGFDRTLTRNPAHVYTAGTGIVSAPYTQVIEGVGTSDCYARISSNVTDAANQTIRLYAQLLTTEVNKDYKFIITYKAEEDVTFNEIIALGEVKLDASNVFTTKEIPYKATEAKTNKAFGFDCKHSFENLCIKSLEWYNVTDNTSVYKWDASLYNNRATRQIPRSAQVSTAVADNDITFTITCSADWYWAASSDADNQAHTFNFYNIYEIIDGERYLRARVARTADSTKTLTTTLKDVTDGVHNFEITCSDDIGLESEAVSVSETIMPYEPKNVTAVHNYSAKGINVSWVNPVATTLNKVSVYQYNSDGTSELLNNTLSTTPGAVVKYTDTDTNDMLVGDSNFMFQNYRIVFEYSDGHKPVEVFTSGKANNSFVENIISNYNSKKFAVKTYDNSKIDTDNSYDNAGVINKIETEGTNHYLKFASNVSSTTERNGTIVFTLTTAMTKNAKHKLSMRAKSESAVTVNVYTGTFEDGNRKASLSIPASSEWATYETSDITPGWAPTSIILEFVGSIDGLSIDDLKLYVTDTPTEIKGEQTFEGYDFTKPSVSQGVTVEVGDGEVTLNIASSKNWWIAADAEKDNIARTYTYYNVYEVVNGIDVHRARVTRVANNGGVIPVKLSNLTNGKTYTYKVTCEDNYGVRESEAITCTVTPQGRFSSVFTLKNASGEVVDELTDGTYSVTATVDNTFKTTNARLIVGVYDGDQLVSAYLAEPTIINNGAVDQTISIQNILVEDTADYEVELKCFIWEDLTKLTPLCISKIFTE